MAFTATINTIASYTKINGILASAIASLNAVVGIYVPPEGDAVDFVFIGSYSAPDGDAADFSF